MKKYLLFLMFFSSFFIIIGCTGEVDPIIYEPHEYSLFGGLDDYDYSKVVPGKIFTDVHPYTFSDTSYVFFGNYPKNEVTSPEITFALGALTPDQEGYLTYKNNKYVRVDITNRYVKIGDTIYTDQRYTNLTGYAPGKTYYFKVVPLLWQVLNYNPETKVAFLLTANIIDTQIYNSKTEAFEVDGNIVYPSNYQYSDVRHFLNNTFYNKAFNSSEKEQILTTTVVNNQFYTYFDPIEELNNTEDKIFLLNFKEVTSTKYGFDPTLSFSDDDNTILTTSSRSRLAQSTDYALANGSVSVSYGDTYTGIWLLRTGSNYNRHMAPYITFDGYAHQIFYLDAWSSGVRAACYVQL